MSWINQTLYPYLLPLTAGGLQDSTIITGTQKLIEDATKGLAVIAGVTTILVTLFFLLRALLSEAERPRYFKAAGITAAIGVVITLVSALISIIMGYYQ